MTEVPKRFDQQKINELLLGYQCKPGMQEVVVARLELMNHEDRSMVYDWAIYSFNDLPYLAYDHVANYRKFDPKREDVIAQRGVSGYLDNMNSWLELVKRADTIPLLDYEKPEDGVGEEIEWFAWSLEKGGARDDLFREQIEYLQDQLKEYREYTLGTKRMILHPDSVIERLPSEERKEEEVRKALEALQGIATSIAPVMPVLHKMLESVGVDPSEVFQT